MSIPDFARLVHALPYTSSVYFDDDAHIVEIRADNVLLRVCLLPNEVGKSLRPWVVIAHPDWAPDEAARVSGATWRTALEALRQRARVELLAPPSVRRGAMQAVLFAVTEVLRER